MVYQYCIVFDYYRKLDVVQKTANEISSQTGNQVCQLCAISIVCSFHAFDIVSFRTSMHHCIYTYCTVCIPYILIMSKLHFLATESSHFWTLFFSHSTINTLVALLFQSTSHAIVLWQYHMKAPPAH